MKLAAAAIALIAHTKAQKPLVVLFSLQEERTTAWYNESAQSLIQYGYDHITMNATHKNVADDTLKELGVHITHKSHAQRGCWASHLRAWALQEYIKRPIISVEADTKAVRQITYLHQQSKNYDILFAHDHRERKQKCRNQQEGIQQGIRARYATGAMIFTGKTPLRNFIHLINTHLPIGHWLNYVDSTKKLKIASYCPSIFYQRTDKPSLIKI